MLLPGLRVLRIFTFLGIKPGGPGRVPQLSMKQSDSRAAVTPDDILAHIPAFNSSRGMWHMFHIPAPETFNSLRRSPPNPSPPNPSPPKVQTLLEGPWGLCRRCADVHHRVSPPENLSAKPGSGTGHFSLVNHLMVNLTSRVKGKVKEGAGSCGIFMRVRSAPWDAPLPCFMQPCLHIISCCT